MKIIKFNFGNNLFTLQSDLPATVRVVQERMLEVLKESIKDKAKEEKEKKIVKRSKKVKFFGKRYNGSSLVTVTKR